MLKFLLTLTYAYKISMEQVCDETLIKRMKTNEQ